jgi:hypothetical protein
MTSETNNLTPEDLKDIREVLEESMYAVQLSPREYKYQTTLKVRLSDTEELMFNIRDMNRDDFMKSVQMIKQMYRTIKEKKKIKKENIQEELDKNF